MNERDRVAMDSDEVAAFLAGNRTLAVATVNVDGSIHLVAMFYGFLEGAIVLTSKPKAQKILNVRRNPNITVMAETGIEYRKLMGVQIRGTAEVVEDSDRRFAAGISIYERRTGQYADGDRGHVEAMLHKRVVIKVHPVKIASWNHRKLELPFHQEGPG